MITLFFIGGFLGSGKTTAIRQTCTMLLENGIKAGVITNDQGAMLVDTRFIREASIPVMEVPEGCFCCNYDQLEQRIQSLQETDRPEVIFAESVGSCTDLVATVIKPMLKFHQGVKIVFSVFADACLLPVLLKGSRLFTDNVNYIYKKQLEEADIIIVNKIDLVTSVQLEEIKLLMETRYSHKVVLYQNSLERRDLDYWFTALSTFQPAGSRRSLDIDYDVYGAGEAELAWLDDEIEINTSEGNAADAATQLINGIYSKIKEQRFSIGHLKFLLESGDHQEKISYTTIDQPAFRYKSEKLKTANYVKILVNARLQTEPYLLEKIVSDSINELKVQEDCEINEKNRVAFKPGYPKPTHRV
jgi:Ni2+-binding GTPase involved in maturation of urease and hydrogenase